MECQHVPQTFSDPSTGIHHPCMLACIYEDPTLSPPDCKERCPELYRCLMSKFTTESPHETIGPTTIYEDDASPMAFVPQIIMIGVALFLLVFFVILVVYISLKRRSYRKLAVADSENNTRNASQIPSLQWNETPDLVPTDKILV